MPLFIKLENAACWRVGPKCLLHIIHAVYPNINDYRSDEDLLKSINNQHYNLSIADLLSLLAEKYSL